MDEAKLREIEQTLEQGRRALPRTTWSLMQTLDADLPALVAEMRRLRRELLTIADDSDDIATYWAICDLIGEEPPSPEPRSRP